MTQDENEWPKCEAIGDISENVDEKEVIVATNLTSVPQAVPIHSESSPQFHSTHSNSCSHGVCHFINIERFSTFGKLVRVTCWAKRFIRNFQARSCLCEGIYGDLLVEEMEEATLAWCKYEQSFMINEKHFEKQKLNLNLFCDDKGLHRSSTCINIKKLQFLQKQPILVRSELFYKIIDLEMS